MTRNEQYDKRMKKYNNKMTAIQKGECSFCHSERQRRISIK
jgi:hypothetical protein